MENFITILSWLTFFTKIIINNVIIPGSRTRIYGNNVLAKTKLSSHIKKCEKIE